MACRIYHDHRLILNVKTSMFKGDAGMSQGFTFDPTDSNE